MLVKFQVLRDALLVSCWSYDDFALLKSWFQTTFVLVYFSETTTIYCLTALLPCLTGQYVLCLCIGCPNVQADKVSYLVPGNTYYAGLFPLQVIQTPSFIQIQIK